MKKAMKALFVLLLVILTVSGALAAEKKVKPEIKTMDNYIAVFDFEVTTGEQGISRPLTESVRRELVMSGKYEVIDRGNMNKILGEQKFQISGCVAQECIVDAGQLLGVGKIISGTVSIVGKTYYLTLSLISVKTGKIENVAEDTCRCEVDELLGSTKRLAKKLLGEQVAPPAATEPRPATVAESKDDAIAKAEATAKAKAEETARAEQIAKARAKADAIAKAEEIEKAKAAQIAEAKAEAEATAKARAKADAIAKAEEIERAKTAQIAKAKAEAEEIVRAKAKADAIARAEEVERAKAAQAAKVKAEAEEKARTDAAVKAKADAIAKAETKQHGLKATTAAIDPALISPKIAASDGRFEKFASGVVRDTKSGLDWYAGPDKNIGWDDAKQWAAGLRVDGGGWRMPTRNELKSLYQKGSGSRNMTSLLETTGWLIWSGETGSQESRSFGSAEWALDFGNGSELLDRSDNSIYKRGFAVRSTPKPATAEIDPAGVSTKNVSPDGRFEKLASGVVRDTKSGLDWYAGPDKNTGWDDAKQWAAGLRVDGGGWRMPTRNELKGLYKKGAGSRNMTSLLETTGWLVWSGETGSQESRSFGSAEWALDFGNGSELLDRSDNSVYKRGFAVRSTSKYAAAAIDPAMVSTKVIVTDGRFEKLTSGVVRDKQSGLDWYAGPDKNTVRDDVKQWVADLRVDGGGWRMPTITELKSLYQKGVGSRNMTPLLETTGWWVWSADTGGLGQVAGNSGWALDFDNGIELLDRRENSNYKRGFAVRSTPKTQTAAIDPAVVSVKIVASDGRFQKLASGVVRDTQNGLDWYAGPDKNTVWDDVKQWTAGLRVDGGGWRMPTITELKGIYQKGAGSRNMTSLLETTGWWVWSGDTGGLGMVAGNSGWALDFDNGIEILDRRDNSSYRRGFAVRSRK